LIDRLKIPRKVELIIYSGEESYTFTNENNGKNIAVLSIDGEKVELKLVGEVSRLKTKHKVLVSQYWTDFGATQESICGQIDYKDAECFKDSHPTIYDRRRPIGRLRPTGCTVWRISSGNRFMTNNHCIGSNNGIQNEEVVYNYQRDGCNSNTNEATVKVGLRRLLKTSTDLDFTLFTVMEPERLRQFGWTGLDISPPDVGKEIFLIHHPRTLPKKITLEDDFSTNGRCVIKSSDNRSLFYTCDSEPGSSGSCMFSERSRRAIGLHKWGGCTGRGNGATRVDKIWPEIREFFNNVVPAGDWEDGNNRPGVWGKWSKWSDCDATCGIGKQKRTRKCESGNCVGPKLDSQSCKTGKDCGNDGNNDDEFKLFPGPYCWTGYEPITSSWQDCESAARAIGQKGDSVCCVDYMANQASFWGTKRPQGCFRSNGNNRIHFNKGLGGNSQGGDHILCRKKTTSCPIHHAGRCGPKFGNSICSGEPDGQGNMLLYCNEANGWCGDTNAHKNAQASVKYDFSSMPKNCGSTTTSASLPPNPNPRPVWSNWGSWSSCDNDCGQGTKTRKRTCKTSGCLGDASLVEVCVGSACPNYIPPKGCECVNASVDKRFGRKNFNSCDVDPRDNKAKCYIKKPCLASLIKGPHFVSCIDTKKVVDTGSGKKMFKDYIAVTEGVCPKGSERIMSLAECRSALQFVAGFSYTSFEVVDNLTKPGGCSYNKEGEKWTLHYNLSLKSMKGATSSELVICAIV